MKSSPQGSADPTAPTAAPWFYRQRFTVFGIVYGLAFYVGFLIVHLAGTSPLPVYRALGHPSALFTLAATAIIGGYALRVWASSYISSAIVWSNDPLSTKLRVSGPYRFTRNPLYLGNILQSIGIGLVTPWPVCVLIVAGVFVLDYGLIVVEERFLMRQQGEAYERYCATVPRLFPIPGKSAPPGDQPASLRDGLRAEVMISLFSIAIFVLVASATRS